MKAQKLMALGTASRIPSHEHSKKSQRMPVSSVYSGISSVYSRKRLSRWSTLMKIIKLSLVSILIFITCGWQQTASTPPATYRISEHYTKYEYRIEMRDGARLFTAVYVPKDLSHSYPFLILRTPYGVAPYGADQYRTKLGPSRTFDQAGYIFVFQDVRGRYMSEGTFETMTPHIDHKTSNKQVDASTDTYDTVDWLLKHVPNNNGNVGIWGVSYPGFYTSAGVIDSHPAIKAASPEAPMTDLFMGDDAYHGGAFMLSQTFDFYSSFMPQPVPMLPPTIQPKFDYGTADGYDFFLNAGPLSDVKQALHNNNPLFSEQVTHTTYDEFWKLRNLAPHLKNIHCAVLTVGGWFDAEDLRGPFATYESIEKNNPGIFNALVIGPWSHGGWTHYDGSSLGRVGFNSNTADFFRESILFPFFEHFLKGSPELKLPEAYVFETGTNIWRQYDKWPPTDSQARTLYLRKSGGLSLDPPDKSSEGFDAYVSDPDKPVPFVDYPAVGGPYEYMVSDQRFASKRADVLTYQTLPLAADVTIVGPIAPRLFVSTSGTDSDFIVKLIDVYPSDYPDNNAAVETPAVNDVQPPPHATMRGYQQLIRGEPMRGKFRTSFESPEPFIPGKVEKIQFVMPDVNHTFRRGHRIMIQLQSSWFPLIDRNPQTFVDTFAAKPSDFRKVEERIYRTAEFPSGIDVHVLSGSQTSPF
jgi:uncharacterized protein